MKQFIEDLKRTVSYMFAIFVGGCIAAAFLLAGFLN